ncbi:MAG: efflux RND transporter periplasmic adaptor subunit [Thermodesulfovibrionales bacterium]
MKKHSFFVTACCLLFTVNCLLFLPACKGKEQQMKKPAAPVTVGTVVKKTVPVQIRAIGNVEAYSTVSIKARVGGELEKVYFLEGQDVNKGSLLFTIDPLTYKTALNAAQANLARDTALAKKAEEDVARYKELYKEQLVSGSQYEQIFANAEAMKATLKADAAAVENAGLQLSYCSIYAPVSGRTGSLLVNQGNLIKANDDKPMVVINQIQPVYVTFSVPEQYLPEIKLRMKSGNLSVEAFVSRDDKNPFHGVLTFVDNTVDTATGTIKLKATFDNKDRALWPGQFVTVRITLLTIQDAVVVSSQAVQTGQQGQFVFVVKDEAAELRPVTAGITYEDMTVIEKGLAPGEIVVTDGQMRLMPGAKVEIKKAQEQKSNSQKESLKTETPAKDTTK